MPKVVREVRQFVPDQRLPSDNGEAERTETETAGDSSMEGSGTGGSEVDKDESYDEDAYSEENDEDDWVPPSTSARSKTSKPKVGARLDLKESTAVEATSHQTRVAKLAQDIDGLSFNGPDDSMIILPAKNYKNIHASSNSDHDDNEESDNQPLPPVKKKKRYVS